jgi:hypothetical protein
VALNLEAQLRPLGGEPITLSQQTQIFHLVAIVLDPYTKQSAWILETAGRILSELQGADCRTAWVVTADEEDTRTFLGPWAERILTFCDPERELVESFGLEQTPALVHVSTGQQLEGVAQGWDPDEWRPITDHLAKILAWNRPGYPKPVDPIAFPGAPVRG